MANQYTRWTGKFMKGKKQGHVYDNVAENKYGLICFWEDTPVK